MTHPDLSFTLAQQIRDAVDAHPGPLTVDDVLIACLGYMTSLLQTNYAGAALEAQVVRYLLTFALMHGIRCLDLERPTDVTQN